MMIKWKITLYSYGQTSAIIVFVDQWNPSGLYNEVINKGCEWNNVIRIERVLEADDLSTQDYTING